MDDSRGSAAPEPAADDEEWNRVDDADVSPHKHRSQGGRAATIHPPLVLRGGTAAPHHICVCRATNSAGSKQLS